MLQLLHLSLTRFNSMRCSTSEYISFVALDPELLAYLGGPDDANMDDIEGSRAVADALTAQALASPRPSRRA